MWITFLDFLDININAWTNESPKLEIEESFPHRVEKHLSTRNVNEV